MSDEERNADQADFTALLDFLHKTANELAKLTDGLSMDEFRLKTSESEFSALENLCHLRDLELEGYTSRIKRILNEGDPALTDFDGARVAAESSYNDEQPELALQRFQTARSENLQTLKTLTEEQLERSGKLEGVGNITLRRLAEMMCEHDEGHIEDLRVLRQRLERRRSAIASEPRQAVATGPMLNEE
jgi:hypothetical protein